MSNNIFNLSPNLNVQELCDKIHELEQRIEKLEQYKDVTAVVLNENSKSLDHTMLKLAKLARLQGTVSNCKDADCLICTANKEDDNEI